MILVNLYNSLFWTIAFCLGLHKITQEGQLLHFIRKPFFKLNSDLENLEDKINNAKSWEPSQLPYLYKKKTKIKLTLFFAKPLCHCITCMASIWGVSIFIFFNGFSLNLIGYIALNSIAASFIQTFIWNLYENRIQ